MKVLAKAADFTDSSKAASWSLFLILALALFIRVIAFNGAFGSDDMVYYYRSLELSRGIWSSSDYNGALRYGFNIPAAIFMHFFGISFTSANLWPLLCSLIEVTAVFIFVNEVMGRRCAIFCALLMLSAPLHISVATRIHADPVVSMFLTLSFVLLYFGARRRENALSLVTGITLGGIFWTKELAAITWISLIPFLYLFRNQALRLLWIIAGVLAMLVLHAALMSLIAKDPLHLIKSVLIAMNKNFIQGDQGEDNPVYYFKYLFFDIRHTFLLGFLALYSLILLRSDKFSINTHQGILFSFIWLTSLLTVLSAFPISLSPIKFAMKQSNYISLFLAPLSILSGMTISTLPKRFGNAILVICISCGILLGLLQQADYRAFTANSKSVTEFAISHPKSIIIGSVNNSHLGGFWGDVHYPGIERAKIYDFRALQKNDAEIREQLTQTSEILVVLDPQTKEWGSKKLSLDQVRSCWRYIETLKPADLGLGNSLASWISSVIGNKLPANNLFLRLASPEPAKVYRVLGTDVFCQQESD